MAASSASCEGSLLSAESGRRRKPPLRKGRSTSQGEEAIVAAFATAVVREGGALMSCSLLNISRVAADAARALPDDREPLRGYVARGGV